MRKGKRFLGHSKLVQPRCYQLSRCWFNVGLVPIPLRLFLSNSKFDKKIVAIGWLCYEQGHCKVSLNFESDRNIALEWRHDGLDSVSKHKPHDCLLNRLFRRRSKKTSKLRVTGLCEGNSPGPVNSPHEWSVTQEMFPFDDVIMISGTGARSPPLYQSCMTNLQIMWLMVIHLTVDSYRHL